MEDKCLHAARWLELRSKTYRNGNGEAKAWDYVRRRGTRAAVCAVAVRPGPPPELLLVRQFRHPMETEVLEFPAGLVDEHESLESAALRELREETGWRGELVSIGPPVPTSPGLTDECVAYAHVRLATPGSPELDGDEAIATEWAPLEDLLAWLQRRVDEGVLVDARVWAFACGRGFATP